MIQNDDVHGKILYEDNQHKFIWLGSESQYRKGAVQTMQYLIIDNGRGVLLDPGGVHLFSRVVTAVSRFISVDKVDTIFFSHQDPDVSSGIALWLGITGALFAPLRHSRHNSCYRYSRQGDGYTVGFGLAYEMCSLALYAFAGSFQLV